MNRAHRAFIFAVLGVLVASVSAAAVEFPPGVFSDNAPIRIAECRGKVVVLLFFDPGAERDWGDPEVARWMVSAYRDRPVKFVAVVPGRTIEEVRGTPADTPDVPAVAFLNSARKGRPAMRKPNVLEVSKRGALK